MGALKLKSWNRAKSGLTLKRLTPSMMMTTFLLRTTKFRDGQVGKSDFCAGSTATPLHPSAQRCRPGYVGNGMKLINQPGSSANADSYDVYFGTNSNPGFWANQVGARTTVLPALR